MKQFETFRDIGSYEISNLIQETPSCFNGWVRVTKYRITIEEIKEPVDIIRKRLKKLWKECDNHHHWEPLRATAHKYGLELKRR